VVLPAEHIWPLASRNRLCRLLQRARPALQPIAARLSLSHSGISEMLVGYLVVLAIDAEVHAAASRRPAAALGLNTLAVRETRTPNVVLPPGTARLRT